MSPFLHLWSSLPYKLLSSCSSTYKALQTLSNTELHDEALNLPWATITPLSALQKPVTPFENTRNPSALNSRDELVEDGGSRTTPKTDAARKKPAEENRSTNFNILKHLIEMYTKLQPTINVILLNVNLPEIRVSCTTWIQMLTFAITYLSGFKYE
jgi:hypothetical protein